MNVQNCKYMCTKYFVRIHTQIIVNNATESILSFGFGLD